jgi:hypothetical protein
MIENTESLQRRPRFSLLTVLVFMALVACGIMILQLWREVGPLRAEVRQLRDETGRLTVDDESVVHAIRVPAGEGEPAKWRVWVPDGVSAAVNVAIGDIPKSGVPQVKKTVELPAGESWLTLGFKQHPDSGRWLVDLTTQKVSVGGIIPVEQEWFDWPTLASSGEAVGTQTVMASRSQRFLVLKRYRVARVAGSGDVDMLGGPLYGYVLWLEWQ